MLRAMPRGGAMLRLAALTSLLALAAGAAPADAMLRGVDLRSRSGQTLPEMKYRFTSFATSAPEEAGSFCEKYLGAVRIGTSEFLTHRNVSDAAKVVGLRFVYASGTQFHDLYFVRDPSKASGGMTPDQYLGHLHSAHHFKIQETWDWYMDWHLCFTVDFVDLIAYRLVRDNVPVVSRSSYSFYVEIPYGITFQFLGSQMDVIWSEPFNFCRYTDGTGQFQPLQLESLPEPLPPIPELPPSHHSFFSSKPFDAFNFTLKHTSGTRFDMDKVWADSHRYSDGRCAQLLWLQLPGYQIHFVDQFRKFEGDLPIKQTEHFLTDLHGGMTEQDAFFDFRVGFEVSSLAPFRRSLESDGSRYLLSGDRSLFMQIPGGIILELLEADPPAAASSVAAAATLSLGAGRASAIGGAPVEALAGLAALLAAVALRVATRARSRSKGEQQNQAYVMIS